jgi:hypothetical protein
MTVLEALEGCPPTMNVLAARLVIDIYTERDDDQPLSGTMDLTTLLTIRPFLSGVILRDVTDLLDHVDTPLQEIFERWFGPRRSHEPELPAFA